MPYILLFIISSFVAVQSHSLILGGFKNRSACKTLDSLPDALSRAFDGKFTGFGIKVIRHENEGASQYYSTMEETILFTECSGADTIWVRFRIETGDDRRVFQKEFVYDTQAALDQNIVVMMVKIMAVFENQILSITQVASEPLFADLMIDNASVRKTPWEGRLSRGPHLLRLTMPGYVPFEKRITVLPGNNRFEYSLLPENQNPVWPPPEKKRILEKKFLLPAIAGLVVGVTGQVFYRGASRDYDALISPNRRDYDAFHNKATAWLWTRNSAFGISLVATGLTIYSYITQ